MKGTATRTRRFARRLVGAASKLLPTHRREWVNDMRAELEYLSDADALAWAIGSLFASIHERVLSMSQRPQQISRWVLGLEWLACFGSLTLLWGVAARFIVVYGPTADILIATATGTLGPVALALAMICTVSNAYSRFARIFKVLAIGFASFALLQLMNAGAANRLSLSWFEYDLSLFVLCALLPLLGCLHLLHLGQNEASLLRSSA